MESAVYPVGSYHGGIHAPVDLFFLTGYNGELI